MTSEPSKFKPKNSAALSPVGIVYLLMVVIGVLTALFLATRT